MDVFKNTKIFKKFILIVLIVIAFNVIAPKPVKAGDGLEGAISKFIFWIERGIIRVCNNVFCDSRHAYQYIPDEEGSAIVYISPESIIKGKFAILNANIFEDITDPYVDASNPEKDEYYDTYYSGEDLGGADGEDADGEEADGEEADGEDADAEEADGEDADAEEGSSLGDKAEEAADKATSYMIEGRTELRNTVAGWYYALRNLAIVALLSILVYVGIRMVISTMSQDKAKYKTMLKDWLVALCLLMTMHYIMVGALNITSMITDAIGTTGRNTGVIQSIMNRIQSINNSEEADHQIELNSKGLPVESGEKGELYTIGDAFAYELVLLGIIGYTLIFAVKYLMRMMTIVFLVLVAPITAITYPIDKISDGKAQAFNTWLQEFIYQVIIQPFHLLIYIVLVGSATTLADTNWLYSIMCFAVMIPSEKFIKQMFGFKDKLSSPLGAFAGGAIASQLASKVLSKDGSSSGDKEKETSTKDENDTSLRESKNKPELPGSEQGSGTPTTYERNQNDNTTSESNNNENNNLEHNNNQLEEGQEGAEGSDDNNSDIDYADLDEEELAYLYNDRVAERQEKEQQKLEEQMNQQEMEEGQDDGQVRQQELEEGQDNEQDKSEENTALYNPDAEPISVTSGASSSDRNASNRANAFNAVRERYNTRLAAKYGTTHKGLWYKDENGNLKRGVAGKYLSKKALNGGKRFIKGATTLAGGLAGAAIGTMFGKGKAGMAAGAALGNKVGSGINNLGSKAYKRVSPYVKEANYARKDEETRRKESLEKIKNTAKERNSASIEFSKRNNGRIASPKELEKELEERARFRAAGVSESQIDNAMEVYHNRLEKGQGEAIAFGGAYYAADLLDNYKAADFSDEKKMGNEYDNLMEQFRLQGVNQDIADENAREILGDAAGVHGRIPSIPVPSRKEEFISNSENRAMAAESYKARHNNAEPTQQQIDQELEIGYDLRRQDVDESQIKDFYQNYIGNKDARDEAKKTVGDSKDEQVITTEVARRFQIKAKINQPNISESDLTSHINNATQFIKDNNHVSAPTTNQVAREVRQQIEVKDSYHVSSSEINKIRSSEEAFANRANDKSGARAVIAQQRKNANAEIAKETTPRGKARAATRETVKAKYQREILGKHSSKEMQDNNVMDKVYEELNTKLESAGLNVSAEHRGQIAEGIINTSRGMAGIKGEYKYIPDRGNVT